MSLWIRICAAALAGLLYGCASQGPVIPAHLPDHRSVTSTELEDTPFFPQDRYQCGPAALATVLTASGKPVTAQELVPQVYVPDRRGSLQPELLAAMRRHGRVPYVIPPTLSALLREVSAGHPVLVLQNLGIDLLPVWHYAVVIGFDRGSDTMTLRSGEQRRRMMSAADFLRSWERGESWGVVSLRPGELPASDEPARYIQAVSGLEETGHLEAARRGYEAGLRRWSHNDTLYLGLGNTHYQLGDLASAEQAYREALALAPDNVAARNNLANVLLERNCFDAALKAVNTALSHLSPTASLRPMVEDTHEAIVAARGNAVDSQACAPQP